VDETGEDLDDNSTGSILGSGQRCEDVFRVSSDARGA
jgi:hypothetical protein